MPNTLFSFILVFFFVNFAFADVTEDLQAFNQAAKNASNIGQYISIFINHSKTSLQEKQYQKAETGLEKLSTSETSLHGYRTTMVQKATSISSKLGKDTDTPKNVGILESVQKSLQGQLDDTQGTEKAVESDLLPLINEAKEGEEKKTLQNLYFQIIGSLSTSQKALENGLKDVNQTIGKLLPTWEEYLKAHGKEISDSIYKNQLEPATDQEIQANMRKAKDFNSWAFHYLCKTSILNRIQYFIAQGMYVFPSTDKGDEKEWNLPHKSTCRKYARAYKNIDDKALAEVRQRLIEEHKIKAP